MMCYTCINYLHLSLFTQACHWVFSPYDRKHDSYYPRSIDIALALTLKMLYGGSALIYIYWYIVGVNYIVRQRPYI
ncbi:hypothetical protein FOG31_00450 [Staphylococcus aureus]|nr:hypothetical protein [Staphylococcus aureus]MBZ8163413.1 hypothetical protein [Staphylococcus aureus]MBZ8166189.1 hypothetical protein [Staphylococcus aureus]MBZ8170146.1 hypothetical protein [Staphylococcus aureus]